MLDLTGKDFKAGIINIFKELKEIMLKERSDDSTVSDQLKNTSPKTESMK